MRIFLLFTALMTFFVFSTAYAEEKGTMKGGMMGPYLSEEQVMKMKKMMMEMPPDTLEASIKRGEKLFKDNTLGKNTTGTSCANCHPGGGTVGGAATMEWKGMQMQVNIPDLHGAAVHFPKAVGPMRMVATLAGQNNLCIMTFMKGAPLDLNSQEATDLAAYVSSLSAGMKYTPGAAKIVPKPVPGAM